MTLNPVESSMVVKVGFDPASGILRAVMKDGSAYDVPASAAEFAEFMASRSKGSYWHKVFDPRAHRAEEVVRLREPEQASAAERPLDIFDPDPCCGAALSKALRALTAVTSWECPKCGTEWKPRLREGGRVRHWEPHPAIMIFGGKR